MSTLPLRATAVPQIWPIPGIVRLGAYLAFLVDVYADAQHEMRVLNKKYPFAGI